MVGILGRDRLLFHALLRLDEQNPGIDALLNKPAAAGRHRLLRALSKFGRDDRTRGHSVYRAWSISLVCLC